MLINKRIPFSYIFRKVYKDVIRVLTISVIIHLLKLFYTDHIPEIPFLLPSLLGTSISLILAFNINQSYDRWWEARKVWGAIVNDSRSLVLQLKGFISDQVLSVQESDSILKKMAFRQIAWCYSLGQSLRGLDAAAGITEYISEEERDFIKTQNNKPFSLLLFHMNDLKTLYNDNAINSYQQVQIDSTIIRLCDSMGKAERINSTVFPVTYILFVHFFIFLFLITLSLALVETIGFFEIPVLTAIASTFFLLEKTARHLQDPFRNKPTDTAVTAIARTIEINLKQILEEQKVPKPLEPVGFYLM